MPTQIKTAPVDVAELERQGALVTALFRLGLRLQHAMTADAGTAHTHLTEAVAEIESLIATARSRAFDMVTRELSDLDRRGPVPVSYAAVVQRLPVPPRVSAGDLSRLLDQSRLLSDRLRRVTVALAITEDLVADTYDQMARSRPRHAEDYLLAAKRARTRGEEFRDVVDRLTNRP